MAKPDLKSALKQLDPSNDEHWTSDGSPAVKAVEAALNASTNRASIIEADPELTRDKARERAAASSADTIKKTVETARETIANAATGTTTAPATEAEQAAAADHRPEGQPPEVAAVVDTAVTGEAPPLEHADTAMVEEGGHPAQVSPGAPGEAPLDTTDVTGGGTGRPAAGVGWDPGERVEPETSDGTAAEQEQARAEGDPGAADTTLVEGARPAVGTSFDTGERVPPQKADDSEPAIDLNPGPHVPPVQADGAIPETVDPYAFQPRAGTAPALQDAPLSIEPTKEDIAAASDVDYEAAQGEYEQLSDELNELNQDRDTINRRIQEVQARRDAIITAREVGTDNHVDATRAYFAAQDAEKAEQVQLRQAQRALLQGLSPDVGASQLDQAAAMAGKRGHGQGRHAARPLAKS